MKHQLYLGIDQTGAVDRWGTPKPLPACLIKGNQIRFFYLRNLSKSELTNHIEQRELKNLLISIDCVLGLPRELSLSWRKALRRLSQFNAYGKKYARRYFRSIGQGRVMRRKVEILCNAQSVFQEKPFQKNIQTGSFRIWKDISLSPKDFYVPALERQRKNASVPLYEGYPSLSWKILLGVKKRSPSELAQLLAVSGLDICWTHSHQISVNKDPNLADALILALSIRAFRGDAVKQRAHGEGWILGVQRLRN